MECCRCVSRCGVKKDWGTGRLEDRDDRDDREERAKGRRGYEGAIRRKLKERGTGRLGDREREWTRGREDDWDDWDEGTKEHLSLS